MFCRHDGWSHETAWEGGPYTCLRFNLGGSITPATDGAWDRLVLADCPLNTPLRIACATSLFSPLSLTTPFDSNAYGGSIFTFDELKRANKDHPEASPIPLHRGDRAPHPEGMQALLPRIFPLGKGGDVPADLVLTVYDAPAALHMKRWRRDNEDSEQ